MCEVNYRRIGKLLARFASFLDGRGFEIVEPECVRQEVRGSYRLAKQIFKNRTVLVPFMCKVAINVAGGKIVAYTVGNAEEANVLRNFLEGLKTTGHALDYSFNGNCVSVNVPVDKQKRMFYRSEWAEECFRYVISKYLSRSCWSILRTSRNEWLN